MASDFEKLAAAHEGDSSKLIAEVDCTDPKSEALCQENGVQGFPSLKYGDPSSLADYQGGRDFQSMHGFVLSDVKVSCSPFNVDLCSDEEKKMIGDVMELDDEEIAKKVEEAESLMKEADEELEKGIEGLQSRFQSMMEKHEDEVEKMKENFDYNLMKAVLKMKKADAGITDDDDDEEAFDDDDDDDDDDEYGEEEED